MSLVSIEDNKIIKMLIGKTNKIGELRSEVKRLNGLLSEKHMQDTLMVYSPANSDDIMPYPSDAKQWREYHGKEAWLYNPWTGEPRDARDIGSDTFGHLIQPPEKGDIK